MGTVIVLVETIMQTSVFDREKNPKFPTCFVAREQRYDCLPHRTPSRYDQCVALSPEDEWRVLLSHIRRTIRPKISNKLCRRDACCSEDLRGHAGLDLCAAQTARNRRGLYLGFW